MARIHDIAHAEGDADAAGYARLARARAAKVQARQAHHTNPQDNALKQRYLAAKAHCKQADGAMRFG